MRPSVDFIGVGAQRAGTSWIYACLYEHPEICAPIKELHYFSRERNYEKGVDWYLSHFERCPPASMRGEFSTSYLSSPEAAARIHQHFPGAKIVISLRNPVARADSQYRNAIQAGEIPRTSSFASYLQQEESAVAQGLYNEQVKRYLETFGPGAVLVLVLEDARADPRGFVARLYEFLGVDPSFRPSMLLREINTTRTPRLVALDRAMNRFGDALRRAGLDRLVWRVKKSGLPERLRLLNTSRDRRPGSDDEREALRERFRADALELSRLLDRDFVELWKL